MKNTAKDTVSDPYYNVIKFIDQVYRTWSINHGKHWYGFLEEQDVYTPNKMFSIFPNNISMHIIIVF